VCLDLGEGHSETFLEPQDGWMFLCAEGCLRKLWSRQTLPILQNQTAKLYPLQWHLLWGYPFHTTCVLQPPGSGALLDYTPSQLHVVKCDHRTAQQTRNWSGHVRAVSDALGVSGWPVNSI